MPEETFLPPPPFFLPSFYVSEDRESFKNIFFSAPAKQTNEGQSLNKGGSTGLAVLIKLKDNVLNVGLYRQQDEEPPRKWATRDVQTICRTLKGG